MVKLEYRPYLCALLGLTVCVSLYEIAYVQWEGDSRGTPFVSSALTAGNNSDSGTVADNPYGQHNHHHKTIANQSQHKNVTHKSRARSRAASHLFDINNNSGIEESPGLDKTGNRGILSSGRINQDLSGQQQQVQPQEESSALAATGDRKWPKNDFKNLIDIQNDFDFLINQKPCPRSKSPTTIANHNTTNPTHRDATPDVLVLVLVHSAPRNFRKRLTIRQTWANHPDPAMRVYFMLGRVESPTLQFKLEMENERFGDLIQGNFADAYRNMTYKHVMALKWFTYFCADAPILLKTDDDVFVNTPALMEYVRENVDGVRTRRKFVKCRVLKNGAVKRSYRSKWRVSTKEYAAAEYPPYCPGFIVLYSADMVQQLYREAQASKYFWIDDVHVTGTLVQQANATLTPFRDVFFAKDNRKRLTEPYVRNMPLFTDPDLREPEIRKMWRMVAAVDKLKDDARYKEGLREDNEAVAYLAAMDSDGGRGMHGRGLQGVMMMMMTVVGLWSYRVLLTNFEVRIVLF